MSRDIARLIADYARSLIPVDEMGDAAGLDERELWRLKYWSDPVGWARDHIKWRNNRWLAPHQQDILRRLHKEHRVAAYGPRGLGKTTVSAVAVLHFVATRDGFVDWKIPTTAGGYRQLEKYLWPEIHKWARLIRWEKMWRRPWSRRDELMSLNLRGETGEAFAAASDDAALIEGAHATQMLFIFDESKSIADGVFDSVEGMLTGAGLDDREAFLLSISTPGGPVGRFFSICDGEMVDGKFRHNQEAYGDWSVRPVEIEEAISSRMVNPTWAQQRAQQWGINSTLFQNHVLGKFAATASDGVIPSFWTEEAQSRSVKEARGPAEGGGRVVMSVDVSRGGKNETVIAARRGWAMIEMEAFQNNDTMEVVRRVQRMADRLKPQAIVVDVVGVGAGVFDRLRELEYPVVPFHGGSTPPGKDSTGEIEFANYRSWAWWRMRELLHPHGPVKISLLEDRKLLSDLTVVTYVKTATDKLRVEEKDEIEKKLRKLNSNSEDSCSPDRGDAVVMLFADPDVSLYEETYGVHTAASLAEAGVLTTVGVGDLERQRERERERLQAEREKTARPLAVRRNELLFGRAHKNHNVMDWDSGPAELTPADHWK